MLIIGVPQRVATPRNARHKVHVAQPEEQRISNPQVAGSSPAVDATNQAFKVDPTATQKVQK
jgi:hypothetical protein